jgi:signal transduction histidine kinase
LLVGQLNELGVPKDSLSQMRQQQLLRQLGNMAASMTQLLKQEQWRMHIHSEVVPIASVLKRSLQRLDTLMKQRKLWLGVHGLAQQIKSEGSGKRSPLVSTQSSLAITGDIVKIELVLYELLVSACQRSQAGGRIDIWCRPLENQWLEVSITDNGTIDPRILADLHEGKTKDILAASTLNKPPVLNLLICQSLMEQLEGELNFYKLQDGRTVSRLLLPLASSN